MYVNSISPQPKTKPKFLFRFMVIGDTSLHDFYKMTLTLLLYIFTNIRYRSHGPGQKRLNCALDHTPLHIAAEHGKILIVKYLTKGFNGRNDDILNPKNGGGRTPMHLAAFRGHYDVVKHFLAILGDKNPASNVPNHGFPFYNDQTPLDLAKKCSHTATHDLIADALKK